MELLKRENISSGAPLEDKEEEEVDIPAVFCTSYSRHLI